MWHRSTLTLLTILTVVISSAFMVFIMVINNGIEKGAVQAYGPYELVIGADGSNMQLMLNTFYHIGAPTGNISYEVYEKLEKQSNLYTHAFPVTRGDSYNGFPLVGVSSEYLSVRYPDAVLTGDLYTNLGEVVIGSHVATSSNLSIGDSFHASHGYTDYEDTHDDIEFTVKGVLPKLGTPDDKAIFTTVNYAWAIHHQANANKGDITSIVIQPSGLMEVQQIQTTFDSMEGVQATYSSKTISEMLSFLDQGSMLVILLSIVCVIIATISVMLALTAVSAHRRKDIGLLRLIGKSKMFILSSLLLEGVLITVIGSIVGIITGHIISFILSGPIFAYAGITINPLEFTIAELFILMGSVVLGCLASLRPALKAYKVNPIVLFQSS